MLRKLEMACCGKLTESEMAASVASLLDSPTLPAIFIGWRSKDLELEVMSEV